MKFLVADDHDIVRLGVKITLLQHYPDAEVIEVAASNDLTSVFKKHSVDVAIIDVHMSQMINLQYVRSINSLHPGCKIIIQSYLPEEVFGIHYIKAGAMAYVHKKYPATVLARAVDLALTNRRFITDEINSQMQQMMLGNGNMFSKLSERETEVLNYLLTGYSVAEIGNALCINSATVSTYKTRIFEKLNTTNLRTLNDLAMVGNIYAGAMC